MSSGESADAAQFPGFDARKLTVLAGTVELPIAFAPGAIAGVFRLGRKPETLDPKLACHDAGIVLVQPIVATRGGRRRGRC